MPRLTSAAKTDKSKKIRQKNSFRATNLPCLSFSVADAFLAFVVDLFPISCSPFTQLFRSDQNRRTGSGVIWHILSVATSSDPQITSQPTAEENEGPFRHDPSLLGHLKRPGPNSFRLDRIEVTTTTLGG
ncbi:hypothetical protein BDV23DRAFT_158518 [Aspergillus alliaceus]|uniref:Uncharacterized protein n=1 Tax=Petromyces alliaceus TaxID=209559 RepID=A0A5N7C465_PETAA|nr:hypothetical protein BDV23DRAFT_158518 [Aspergillus alliaceus]